MHFSDTINLTLTYEFDGKNFGEFLSSTMIFVQERFAQETIILNTRESFMNKIFVFILGYIQELAEKETVTVILSRLKSFQDYLCDGQFIKQFFDEPDVLKLFNGDISTAISKKMISKHQNQIKDMANEQNALFLSSSKEELLKQTKRKFEPLSVTEDSKKKYKRLNQRKEKDPIKESYGLILSQIKFRIKKEIKEIFALVNQFICLTILDSIRNEPEQSSMDPGLRIRISKALNSPSEVTEIGDNSLVSQLYNTISEACVNDGIGKNFEDYISL